jgi:hypothetical protein
MARLRRQYEGYGLDYEMARYLAALAWIQDGMPTFCKVDRMCDEERAHGQEVKCG